MIGARPVADSSRVARGLVTALVLLHLCAPPATRAQAVTSRELAAEAARVVQELARIRGLPGVGSAPRVVVRSREERRRFIIRELARKLPPARLDAERQALSAWGLIPADFDLGGFLTDLVVEQAAAYYDPVGKVMVLANWLDPAAQGDALAHELVHLLQDRQMDLDRFLAGTPGKGDEALARQALIEGEAVALTLDRSLRRQARELALLPDVAALQQSIVTSVSGPVASRAPRFVRALLTFPYAYGLGFVHQFLRRHGWAELSRLYRDPPRSTAQILHPELYLDRREDPLPVALPNLGPILGPSVRRVIEDEAGEFAMTQVLREFLGEGVAATGWRGDRYGVWEDAAGGLVLAARTVWTDPPAAAAFTDAYARAVARKYRLAVPTETTASLTVWQAGTLAFLVEQKSAEVLLVERVPAPALDAIRHAAWGEPPPAAPSRRPHPR